MPFAHFRTPSTKLLRSIGIWRGVLYEECTRDTRDVCRYVDAGVCVIVHIAVWFLYNFLPLFYWQPRIKHTYTFLSNDWNKSFFFSVGGVVFWLLETSHNNNSNSENKTNIKIMKYFLRWFFTLTHTSQSVFGLYYSRCRNFSFSLLFGSLFLIWKKDLFISITHIVRYIRRSVPTSYEDKNPLIMSLRNVAVISDTENNKNNKKINRLQEVRSKMWKILQLICLP